MFSQTKLVPLDDGSAINFVIKNFGLKTNGSFKGLKGKIIFDAENLTSSLFDVTVNAALVNTDNNSRDEHLKKESYFSVEKFNTIHLISTSVKASDKPSEYLFNGNLTIKGVTKPVKFKFTTHKQNNGFLFNGSFNINRRDFNVGGSSFPLSETVSVTLNVLAK